ncbi:hypothetical protein [Kribbella italica]|uniref:Uncharacterized protein n=1 Tax=Kribbella italica TaxID=1540520 RepID=A0A7W9MZ50_9ACTN|nr:hypothetical protein [Kribbella italica]MBB5841037.1 hypothetical protein [Kribbella italica]
MTSYSGGPVAPKRTLTWIAVGCFVLGLVLSGIFVVRLVQNLPKAPTRVDGGTVQLTADGLTVYSTVPALIPPCTAKDASGADIPMERVKGSQQITVNDDTWYVVAQSVGKVPPQEVVVDCDSAGAGGTFYAGPKLAIASLVVSVLLAIGSFLFFFLIGIVLIIVDNVRRRRVRKATMANPGPNNPPTQASTFPTIGQNGVDPDYPVPPADQPRGYTQHGGPGTGNDGVDPDYPAPQPAPPGPGNDGVDPDYPAPPAETDGVDPDYPAPPAETDGVDPDYPAPPRS